jgi:hypothetical protein
MEQKVLLLQIEVDRLKEELDREKTQSAALKKEVEMLNARFKSHGSLLVFGQGRPNQKSQENSEYESNMVQEIINGNDD